MSDASGRSRIRGQDLRPPFPPRYLEQWREPFYDLARPALVDGARILDVGSGARPVVPKEMRPPGCHYVGLDVSAVELERAGPAAYDETHVVDVRERVEALEDTFDLIVSWQVLEHVKPLAVALENLRAYVRPGGLLVAQLSGKFSAYALVAMLVPRRVGARASARLLGRDPETMFRTHYDRCYYRALRKLLRPWSDSEILARYRGAGYFEFSPVLRAAYLKYEDWACRRGYASLATHYLIAARR
jgi:SAM-dependent methyltransferase